MTDTAKQTEIDPLVMRVAEAIIEAVNDDLDGAELPPTTAISPATGMQPETIARLIQDAIPVGEIREVLSKCSPGSPGHIYGQFSLEKDTADLLTKLEPTP